MRFIGYMFDSKEWFSSALIALGVFCVLYVIYQFALGVEYGLINYLWCLLGSRVGYALAMRTIENE